MFAVLPVTFGSVLASLAVVSIERRRSSDHTGAASLPLSITVPSSRFPLALSLCTICYHSISVFCWTMGVMVAMPPFFSSPLHMIGLLIRGASLVVVPVSQSSVTAVAPLPSPLFGVGVLLSAPAVMGVVPPSPAIASIPALPVFVTVPVMLLGVGVLVVSQPILPGILLPFSFRRPAGFVAVPGLHHERTVQVSHHVRMQVESRRHLAALFRVKFVEQGLTACPHVMSPQLVGPLLPHGHGLC